MSPRPQIAGLILVPLLLAGCASVTAAAPPAAPTPVAQSPQAASSAAGAPSAAALMICGEDIRGKVQQVLKLRSPPIPTATDAGGVYTCTYALPAGPMVLSVTQSASVPAARAHFAAAGRTLRAPHPLLGLGAGAVADDLGTALVVKDDLTLRVDATALPAVFGPQDQHRTDLAFEIASDVLGCWTGDE